MHYVTRWQMNSARSRLVESDQTVADVARNFGYVSPKLLLTVRSSVMWASRQGLRSGRDEPLIASSNSGDVIDSNVRSRPEARGESGTTA